MSCEFAEYMYGLEDYITCLILGFTSNSLFTGDRMRFNNNNNSIFEFFMNKSSRSMVMVGMHQVCSLWSAAVFLRKL